MIVRFLEWSCVIDRSRGLAGVLAAVEGSSRIEDALSYWQGLSTAQGREYSLRSGRERADWRMVNYRDLF